jgi:hypothetical protein
MMKNALVKVDGLLNSTKGSIIFYSVIFFLLVFMVLYRLAK